MQAAPYRSPQRLNRNRSKSPVKKKNVAATGTKKNTKPPRAPAKGTNASPSKRKPAGNSKTRKPHKSRSPTKEAKSTHRGVAKGHYSRSIDPSTVAKRIRVYKNGDPFHKGVKVVLNTKQVPSMQAFLDVLNEKIQLQNGAKKLYTTSGLPVKDIDSIEPEKEYVLATNIFTPAAYGGDKGLAAKGMRLGRANSDSGAAPARKPRATRMQRNAATERLSRAPLRKAHSAEPAVQRTKKAGIPKEARGHRRTISNKPRGAPKQQDKPAATRRPAVPKAPAGKKRVPKSYRVDPDDGLKEPVYSNGSSTEHKAVKKRVVRKKPVTKSKSPRPTSKSPARGGTKSIRRAPAPGTPMPRKRTPSPSPRSEYSVDRDRPDTRGSDKDSQRSYNRSNDDDDDGASPGSRHSSKASSGSHRSRSESRSRSRSRSESGSRASVVSKSHSGSRSRSHSESGSHNSPSRSGSSRSRSGSRSHSGSESRSRSNSHSLRSRSRSTSRSRSRSKSR